jgi:cell wall-associated NlpC family hydrolase
MGGVQSIEQLQLGPSPQLPASPRTLPQAPAPTAGLDVQATIVANAVTWLGTPYLWGGCSRSGVDCSCFVQNVLRASGISGVPRTTLTQIAWTRPVPRGQMAVGDLLYFDNTCTGCGPNPTHVGLYIGDGRMADCSDPCKIESIQTAYWQSHFDSVGRIPSL